MNTALDDEDDDYEPLWEDDGGARAETPFFGCACENPLSVDTVCRNCIVLMREQHIATLREELAALEAEAAADEQTHRGGPGMGDERDRWIVGERDPRTGEFPVVTQYGRVVATVMQQADAHLIGAAPDLMARANELPGLTAALDEVRWERDKAVQLLHMLDNQEARHPDVAAFLDGLASRPQQTPGRGTAKP